MHVQSPIIISDKGFEVQRHVYDSINKYALENNYCELVMAQLSDDVITIYFRDRTVIINRLHCLYTNICLLTIIITTVN